jgi:peptidoglycan hydrolase-like protein with peptidoglycan-binding domain
MKSFFTKILIFIGLILLTPLFSYAAGSVNCYPDFSNNLIGQPVSFYIEVINGVGTAYDFTWNGPDGLSGTGEEISHSFSAGLNKVINVTASSTDSSEVLTGSCSINSYLDNEIPTGFSAFCSPNVNEGMIDQNFKWETSLSGELGGDYFIRWKGEGLDETSFNSDKNYTVSYSTPGIKTATMSAFQSRYGDLTPLYNAKISTTEIKCSDSINIKPADPTPLIVTGSCSASDQSIRINNAVNWISNLQISGGTAPYTIKWTDNEGSIGVGSSTSKTYSTTGTKTAYLTVEDASMQFTNINCGDVSIINRSSGGSSNNNDENNATSTVTSTATTTSSNSTTTVNDIENNNEENENTPKYNIVDGYIFNRDQNPGTYSEDIANLQSRLTEEGFYNGLIGGFFGPLTEQTLKECQKANGLPETGILDALTREKLNSRFLPEINANKINKEVPSKISDLTASVIEALGSGFNYLKGKGFFIFIIILIILIGAPIYWLRNNKKEDTK